MNVYSVYYTYYIFAKDTQKRIQKNEKIDPTHKIASKEYKEIKLNVRNDETI